MYVLYECRFVHACENSSVLGVVNFKSAKMLCVCQVFSNSLVFEVGTYVCRHICVPVCVLYAITNDARCVLFVQ